MVTSVQAPPPAIYSAGYDEEPPLSTPLFLYACMLHDATKLHYDWLMENSLRKCEDFALPVGPSLDPNDRPDAIRQRLHPLSSLKSERVIPKGVRGAGPKLIWDRGYYRMLTMVDGKIISIERGLEIGYYVFELFGVKLKGRYAMERKAGCRKETWTLRKLDDDWARYGFDILAGVQRSVATGRTLEEVREDWLRGKAKTACNATGVLLDV
jgi:DNA ligase D-like protein (predicted 3'-phosphoesterase)